MKALIIKNTKIAVALMIDSLIDSSLLTEDFDVIENVSEGKSTLSDVDSSLGKCSITVLPIYQKVNGKLETYYIPKGGFFRNGNGTRLSEDQLLKVLAENITLKSDIKDMVIFLKERRKNTSDLARGWGNGYVIIPKGHPLHGKHYDEIHDMFPELNVHRGLSFSDYVDDFNWKEIPEGSEGGWIVGFDTCHLHDTLEKWSKEAVLKETEKLRDQLLNFSNHK